MTLSNASTSSSSLWLSLYATASILSVAAVTTLAFRNVVASPTEKNNGNDDDKTESKKVSILSTIIQDRRSIFPKQFTTKQVPRAIMEEMLQTAKWAPTHKLTEPWSFIVMESLESRTKVGEFLADLYKTTCESKQFPFSQAKYEKKRSNAIQSSYVIAILCRGSTKAKSEGKQQQKQQQLVNPWWEEICSTAMAVQNMLLVATAYGIGAYWSSGGVEGGNGNSKSSASDTPLLPAEAIALAQSSGVVNSMAIREFLGLSDQDPTVFLGWVFVGDYYGDTDDDKENGKDTGKKTNKKWPQGRRQDLTESGRLIWK